MPNKRASGLRLIGAYVDAELKRAFQREAERRGLTEADLLREIVDRATATRQRKPRK